MASQAIQMNVEYKRPDGSMGIATVNLDWRIIEEKVKQCIARDTNTPSQDIAVISDISSASIMY